MARSPISKTIIDALIRTKLANMAGCGHVEALPVVRCDKGPGGSNWTVPGYIGDRAQADHCKSQLADYLQFLGSQFDMAEEG